MTNISEQEYEKKINIKIKHLIKKLINYQKNQNLFHQKKIKLDNVLQYLKEEVKQYQVQMELQENLQLKNLHLQNLNLNNLKLM